MSLRCQFCFVVSIVCGAALLAACGGPDRPRAVLIGIDSADWKMIDALSEQGRMPHLSALRERGVSGPMQTLVDSPLSPVIWTSVATGKTPVKHGITWFLVDQPDGKRVPVRSHNRRVKALWNILAAGSLRATVVGWWATFPAEDIGDGVVVSDALGFHGFGRTARQGDDRHKTWPVERFAEFDALVPPEQQVLADFAGRFLHLTSDEYRELRFDPVRHSKRDPANPIHLFQQYVVTAQGYTAIAEKLLVEPYDVFLLYYEQLDSLSHLFMKHAPPRLEWVSELDHTRFRDVVSEWYAYQDDLLGRLLAKIDLDTTAVFVVSDHGFKSGERRIRSEQMVDVRTAHLDHEPEGIFLAAGPHIRRGARVEDASVVDVTPTLLHYLGQPVAKDMDGKVLSGIFEPGLAELRPIQYIASYESAGVARHDGGTAEDYGEAELAENLAALETLGYVRGSVDPGEAGEPEAASSPEIHSNLARIHARAGNVEEAVAEFEKALALHPQDAVALLGLSRIAASRGDRARAEHLAKSAVASNPDFPPALAQLADLLLEGGDSDQALRLYRQALALDDVSPSLHLGLGGCLQQAGRPSEAEAAFTRALELDPDSFPAVYYLGVTTFQLGREEEAISRYEQALELDPDHRLAPAVLNNLATAHLARGDTDRAIMRWEEAAAADPAQFEARFNLAKLYLSAGRLDDAIPLLEEAARLSPVHEKLHTLLARAYMHKSRGDDAYRVFTLVRRLYPQNWSAPLGLALLYAGTERPAEARPLLDEALQLGGDEARAEAARYPVLVPLLSNADTQAGTDR